MLSANSACGGGFSGAMCVDMVCTVVRLDGLFQIIARVFARADWTTGASAHSAERTSRRCVRAPGMPWGRFGRATVASAMREARARPRMEERSGAPRGFTARGGAHRNLEIVATRRDGVSDKHIRDHVTLFGWRNMTRPGASKRHHKSARRRPQPRRGHHARLGAGGLAGRPENCRGLGGRRGRRGHRRQHPPTRRDLRRSQRARGRPNSTNIPRADVSSRATA